jgi:magnesium transporter
LFFSKNVQNYYPRHARDKDMIMYVYGVGGDDTQPGVLDLNELLQANNRALLKYIMVENVISLHTDSSRKESSQGFARYDFRAIPVTDDNDQLVGFIPYHDVMNLTHHFVE